MKIKTALILCAGYGKRLNPLTLTTPKPLLKINEITLLENCINLIVSLGIKKILVNTFYLEEKIKNFIEEKKFKIEIKIIKDGNNILNTGGGVLNMINSSKDMDFLVFNPDTYWNSNYLNVIDKMSDMYFNQGIQNILLIVDQKKSYDSRLKGDFGMIGNALNKKKKLHIYTGCQIIKKDLFNNYSKKFFSISEIWNKRLNENDLYGYESLEEFIHLTDLEIYKKLLKNN